ncbi:hypothetical protein DFJ74DRAFT_710292 [Hyaloraphidium curvatum]|nr:hypothetical protein DFJ74DRAFT_710292 [Hyaloraphidium curvatum]
MARRVRARFLLAFCLLLLACAFAGARALHGPESGAHAVSDGAVSESEIPRDGGLEAAESDDEKLQRFVSVDFEGAETFDIDFGVDDDGGVARQPEDVSPGAPAPPAVVTVTETVTVDHVPAATVEGSAGGAQRTDLPPRDRASQSPPFSAAGKVLSSEPDADPELTLAEIAEAAAGVGVAVLSSFGLVVGSVAAAWYLLYRFIFRHNYAIQEIFGLPRTPQTFVPPEFEARPRREPARSALKHGRGGNLSEATGGAPSARRRTRSVSFQNVGDSD